MMEDALRRIKDEIASYSDSLVAGGAGDFAEYRRLTGHVAGLQRAAQIIEDLLARAEQDLD